MIPARPLYFPVKPEPLRMQPGLFRFGTDFGNGAADQHYFPRDATTPHYLREKARVLAQHPERNVFSADDATDERCLAAAHDWFSETLRREGHATAAETPLSELGRELVEDFAVLRVTAEGSDAAIGLHVCFPSGWRPEHVAGQSFAQIHASIPGFDAARSNPASLVQAMVGRGPYVRFVWTISADAALDHHPEQGQQLAWSAATDHGYLRVERQLTVPLPAVNASAFLIRTYLYEFGELTAEQRQTLAKALAAMPPDVLRYKRLSSALPHALALLGAAP